MFRIYVPTQSAEDWKAHLAEPEKQWRSGYSARTLASAWQAAQHDFPPEIQRIFLQSTIQAFASVVPILGIVEHVVPMPGKGYPSQIDLFVLAKASKELVAIAVEGKVSEPFGPTLHEWNTGSANRGIRLSGIQELVGLAAPPPPTIRYQLLHRTASAVSEARRFNATFAVMLVHSFSESGDHFDDFRAFVELYGQQAQTNQLITLTQIAGTHVLTAWVQGDPRFLVA